MTQLGNMLRILSTVLLLLSSSTPAHSQNESLAGSFLSGLLDTITSTADSKDCPGMCVHTLATLICYEVLENIPCPSPSMKCCIEQAHPTTHTASTAATSPSSSTTAVTSTTTAHTPAHTHAQHQQSGQNGRPANAATTAATSKPKQTISAAAATTTTTTTTTTHKPKVTQTNGQKKPTTTSAHSSTNKGTTKPHTTTAAAASSTSTKKTDKPANNDGSTPKECNGVCVAHRIAEYCEAYLTTEGLCKEGTKCCVSLDDYSNTKLPKDIYVPAHLTNANSQQNKTKTTSTTKTSSTSSSSSLTRGPTTTTSSTTATAEPARTKIITSHSNQSKKPSKYKKTQYATTTTTTVAPEQLEDDGEAEGEADEEEANNEDLEKTDDSDAAQVLKECEGECMNGILAIFCDDIDSDAYCPSEGSCCITNHASEPVTPATKITATKPSHKIGLKTPKVPTTQPTQTNGNDILSQILTFAENTLNSATSPAAPVTAPPTPQIIRCPGFCLLNIMAAFCERPSVLLSTPTTCSKGSVCCDNTRAGPPKQPHNRHPTTLSPDPPTAYPYAPHTAILDPREDCPGSCIVSLLSFTCFKNAEMTDLFKCKRSGQTCCAPKSKIPEKQFQTRNDTSYPLAHYPMPPPPMLTQVGIQQYPPQAYPAQLPPYMPPQSTHYPPPPPPPPGMEVPHVLEYPLYAPALVAHQTVVTTAPHTTTTTTTTTTTPKYSKYICGVKGTLRNGRSSTTPALSLTSYVRAKYGVHREARQFVSELNPERTPLQKSTERLKLGSEIVPIQIHNDKLGDLLQNDVMDSNQVRSYTEYVYPSPMNAFDKQLLATLNATSNRRARITGGQDADNGEWCWQVALINGMNQYLCGAALVGTQWVLTAAHCVTNIVRSGDAIFVRVGDHDLTRKYGSPGAQTLRAATTYIHHNHNSETLDNDIALLKLHGLAELRDGVCLVCLPARGVSHAAGKRCTVTGYGYMGEAGPIPLRVREAEIPLVSARDCVRKINSVTEKIFILPASSFCAGGEEGNDACLGDGGGPLVCKDDGFYELAGLVSWGFGCGRSGVPGVYVKVSSFIGWINQIISVNNL